MGLFCKRRDSPGKQDFGRRISTSDAAASPPDASRYVREKKMQDRYVGDVGDFGKFSLLRAMAGGHAPLRLGVVWCRFPDEGHNGDGRHVAYLDRQDYAALDPGLHETLKSLVSDGRRSLSAVQSSGILPHGTIYFEEPVHSASPDRAGPAARALVREGWRQRALAATVRADLVFFDPDNGIEARSVPLTHPRAGKYVFWDDLIPFWERGQSLVIYHHLNRTASAGEQEEGLRVLFRRRLGDLPLLLPLLFRRGSCRHFWIVGQNRHATTLRAAVQRLFAGGWGEHFSPLAEL